MAYSWISFFYQSPILLKDKAILLNILIYNCHLQFVNRIQSYTLLQVLIKSKMTSLTFASFLLWIPEHSFDACSLCDMQWLDMGRHHSLISLVTFGRLSIKAQCLLGMYCCHFVSRAIHSILVKQSSKFFIASLISAHASLPYKRAVSTVTRKFDFLFPLTVLTLIFLAVNLWQTIWACAFLTLMPASELFTQLPKYPKPSTKFSFDYFVACRWRSWFWLKDTYTVLFTFVWGPISFTDKKFQLWKSNLE